MLTNTNYDKKKVNLNKRNEVNIRQSKSDTLSIFFFDLKLINLIN